MKNNKGFGLVEVLVASVILSIVLLGTVQAINNMLLMSQTADIKNNVASIVLSTMGVASNQQTCTAAVTIKPQTYGQAFQFNSLQNGTSLPAYKLTVAKLNFANSVLSETGSDGTKAYYGTITMSLSSNIPIYGGRTLAPRIVLAVYLTVNPAGIITGCGPIMPVLASTPAPSPAPAPSPSPAPAPAPTPQSDPKTDQACSAIGGTMSKGVCTINSTKNGSK